MLLARARRAPARPPTRAAWWVERGGVLSDIVGELARVKGAFEQPTLTLLHQRQAPVIIAIFRSAFGPDARTIPAARLHDQVETYLGELRLDGVADVPGGSGRDLCLRWMRGQWLVRSTEDDGTEVYTLTSHAQVALQQVRSMTRDRASLSEHRISTIVSAVRRFNAQVNPDRAARVSILNAQLSELAAERDRLLAGGDMPTVSDDYMIEGYNEVLQLVSALPSDFARVEEAFSTLRGQVLASFRAESRPAGEVIDDYLKRADSLMTATAEGRAFEGAFALLRDDELLLQLREDLGALLEHPVAGDLLIDGDRRELRNTVNLIRAGIVDVLAQRNRVTATLRDYIVTHDINRDRELDSVLRAIDAELATWMQTAGPNAKVPKALLPSRVEVTHLRERYFDPSTETAPPPLASRDEDRPDNLSLDDLLKAGGPSFTSLREALNAALTGPDPMASLGSLFDSLDPQLRRPVEIFGLLHLATNAQGMTSHEDRELYSTVRPDGSTRDLSVPRVAPTNHQPDRGIPADHAPQEQA
ncbi:DUF3375 domain-containing protein [Pedococcus bigeumensis]|uniref:DUF3375 domain-containing protein n=1 Tax=Pedococcus bigeumensis TaxID=433644 RepID=UPI002FEA75D2